MDEQQRETSKLISFAFHEMITPLVLIRGYKQLVARKLHRLKETGATPEEIQALIKDVEHIETFADNAVGQIHEFNELFQVELGLQYLKPEKLPVTSWMAKFVPAKTSYTGDEHMTVTVSPQVADTIGYWDDHTFYFLMWHVLQNARRYSPKDGDITITADLVRSDVLIAIQDQGMGIPADALEHIFDLGYRADNVRHMWGTGIGLYLAKAAVGLLNGAIWVESPGVGKGSTFFIQLPVVRTDQ